jgi:hypothetical protein
MIKCLFVDVKSIKSEISQDKFDRSKIEEVADLILANDGLLRPLIIKQTGLESYTVIEGNLEYYAAVRAKEKDLKKGEMVNAFLIPIDRQQLAIDQLSLLSETNPSPITTPTNISLSIENLGAHLASIVSQQLQPLQQELNTIRDLKSGLRSIVSQELQPLQQQLNNVIQQLENHNQILELLPQKIENINPQTTTKSPNTTKRKTKDRESPVSDSTAESIVPGKTKPVSTTKRKTKPQESNISELTTKSIVIETTKPTSTNESTIKSQELPISSATEKPIAVEKAKLASTNKSRIKADSLAPIDTDKSVKTLELINTLDRNNLHLRMSKSGIPTSEILAANIITKRDTQPEQKFETWEEIIAAKITKLTPAMAKKIIDKLK